MTLEVEIDAEPENAVTPASTALAVAPVVAIVAPVQQVTVAVRPRVDLFALAAPRQARSGFTAPNDRFQRAEPSQRQAPRALLALPEPAPAPRSVAAVDEVDPSLLSLHALYSEHDRRRPAAATERFLRRAPLASYGALLRDRLLQRCLDGAPLLRPDEFFEEGLAVTGHPGAALLVCCNVARAFAEGGDVIHWQKVNRAKGVYSNGQQQLTSPFRGSSGSTDGDFLPFLFSALPGAEARQHWGRFFGAALLCWYGVRGASTPEEPLNDVESVARKIGLDEQGPRGALRWANALYYYEAARSAEQASRVLAAAQQGARFGLARVDGGVEVPANAPWLAPEAGSAPRLALKQSTLRLIVNTSSPHLRRSAAGVEFSLVCTVAEGLACRFASSVWTDDALSPLAKLLVNELDYKTIDAAARRQVMLRGCLPHEATARPTCELDVGRGFSPVAVTEA
ncbi:MAG TPA: hypothetical protein VG937_10585 [Polyangiaceae bacterium]|nr:hypothetical protein [Polyangiaceae bacterium]